MLFPCCCAPSVCARIIFVDDCWRDITVTRAGVTYPLTFFGDNRATAPLASGTYSWTATAPHGCMANETGSVTITCPQSNVTVTVGRTASAGYVDTGCVVSACCCCGVGPEQWNLYVSNEAANDGIYRNDTITWGATPAGLANLFLGDYGWFGDTVFIDNPTGDEFRYYVTCSFGYYTLSRVFEESIYGNPWRDIVRYRWLIGGGGSGPCVAPTDNECCPFNMYDGDIFNGGDNAVCIQLKEA